MHRLQDLRSSRVQRLTETPVPKRPDPPWKLRLRRKRLRRFSAVTAKTLHAATASARCASAISRVNEKSGCGHQPAVSGCKLCPYGMSLSEQLNSCRSRSGQDQFSSEGFFGNRQDGRPVNSSAAEAIADLCVHRTEGPACVQTRPKQTLGLVNPASEKSRRNQEAALDLLLQIGGDVVDM